MRGGIGVEQSAFLLVWVMTVMSVELPKFVCPRGARGLCKRGTKPFTPRQEYYIACPQCKHCVRCGMHVYSCRCVRVKEV